MDFATLLMYYNKDHFAAAGLPEETAQKIGMSLKNTCSSSRMLLNNTD
jgi:hypothetical protein